MEYMAEAIAMLKNHQSPRRPTNLKLPMWLGPKSDNIHLRSNLVGVTVNRFHHSLRGFGHAAYVRRTTSGFSNFTGRPAANAAACSNASPK